MTETRTRRRKISTPVTAEDANLDLAEPVGLKVANGPAPVELIPLPDQSDGAGTLPGSEVVSTNVPKTKLRSIAICGFAESTRDLANKLDPDVEIWSLNRCYTFLKRWDRWYEVHDEELYTGRTGLRESDYMDLLKNSTCPIFMMHPHPDVPMAVQFPLEQILALGARKYFTTSISYMLAHAIYEHDQGDRIGEIFMYGIDMSAFSEYSYQKPSVEYWCGIAEGRGIKVIVPEIAALLKGPLYGDKHYAEIRDVMSDRIQTIKTKKAELAADMQAAQGALHELAKNWSELKMNPSYKDLMKQREKELNLLVNQNTADLNHAMGQERECQHWLSYMSASQREEDEPESVKLPHAF